jgi:predicted TIM-barrel fold metal-dependent hydrolase
LIIDTHVHIGKMLNFNMQEETLLASMDKYGIDFSLVSNVEGSEVDHEQKTLPKKQQFGQIDLNERLLQFVRKNPEKLGALLWVKPTEGCTAEFEKLIVKNRDIIFGLKVHPFHSKLSFDSPVINKYIELARKYSLVVVTHTANDYESSPQVAYEVALKNPDVNIVMVHMGLGTDNEKAIELISKLPNLYGDTTWVTSDKTLKAIEVCGIDKILFGSDNPIDGLDTYTFYKPYFEDMGNILSKEDYEKLMFKNAIKLFKLNSGSKK